MEPERVREAKRLVEVALEDFCELVFDKTKNVLEETKFGKFSKRYLWSDEETKRVVFSRSQTIIMKNFSKYSASQAPSQLM